ncbi:MAG: isoprenyl transferase [Flavobacteriales bacterium]|nr:isoprenyl transferase [Flavobacteriales bacterium]MCB9449472.1 isoprenyl transferase [Flavobacteriales bacterium]
MNFLEKIKEGHLPEHIAIIMDGNGRWAKSQGKNRIFGHKNGVLAVRDTVEGAAEAGIKYLTLYAFSTENWNRPKLEINALMQLLVQTIHKETKTLLDNQIRLQAIGDIENLPSSCRRELQEAIRKTEGGTRMTLILALSYSSKWELAEAAKKLALQVEKGELDPRDITPQSLSENLCTSGIPDPELLIRTSGERRISNFLLWQIAYAELYFTDIMWPEFRRENLFEAILDFQSRERRFGLTSEQITP